MKTASLDSELLREGLKSYHKALFAVIEFRREVGRIIEEAVENRLPELAAALKMDADELRKEMGPYTSPDRISQKFGGSHAEIDVKIPKAWTSNWTLWFFLWISDDEAPYFATQITLKNPGTAIDRLAAVCKDMGMDVDSAEKYAFIWETVPSDGSRDLAAVCDRVLTRWIALWKKIGGLHQFISKTS
jgi:hypothetical protein